MASEKEPMSEKGASRETSSGDREALRAELDRLARPASSRLDSRRIRDAVRREVPAALPWSVLFPAIHLLLCVVIRGAGGAYAPSLTTVVLWTIVTPVLVLFSAYVRASLTRCEEPTALAAIDDELSSKDRLTAAYEFLRVEEPTPFMVAAIEDARRIVGRAKEARLAAAPARTNLRAAHAGWPLLVILLIAASFFVPTAHDVPRDEQIVASLGGDVLEETPVAESLAPNPSEKAETPGAKPSEQEATSPREGTPQDSPEPSNKKATRGQVGAGKSAQAMTSGGQSSGEGEASSQAQPTQGGSKKDPKKPSNKESEPRERKPKPKEQPRDEKPSVAGAGRGRGKGASRSPTASDWTSKDQIVTEDEEELEDDEDVEDDTDESDARGGVQPHLRQRKPPVNRDLNIGFGNGKPPPFANGRGGPGGVKKQRGVAQLVLGVPFPDHITGQPNPGMTKVTQERIEPQAERAEPVQAQDRPPRSSPMGPLARRELSPWMQDLLKNYYASVRTSKAKE